MSTVAAIISDDPLLRSEAWKAAVDGLVKPDDQVFNVKQLKLPGLTAHDILTELESWPIGDGPRVVVVHDTQKMDSDTADTLLAELEEMPDTSVLILVVDTSDTAKLPAKLNKYITDNKCVYQAGGSTKSAKIDIATNFVKSLFNDAGATIDPSIVSTIVARVGTDCTALRSEVFKLIDLVWSPEGFRKPTEQDLEIVLMEHPDDTSFKLVDAVCSGNVQDAVDLVKDRMTKTEDTTDSEAFRLLALLNRQLTLVWQTKVLLDSMKIDVSKHSIPIELDLHPEPRLNLREVLKKNAWQAKRFVHQAKSLSWDDLDLGFRTIEQMTERLKTNNGVISDPETILTVGVMRMCC